MNNKKRKPSNFKSKKSDWLFDSFQEDFSQNMSESCVAPSNNEVLRVFLYHHTKLGKTISESANITATELLKMQNIIIEPLMEKKNLVRKIKSLYLEYRLVKKHRYKTCKVAMEKKDKFIDSLFNDFNIKLQTKVFPKKNYSKKSQLTAKKLRKKTIKM